MKNNIKTRNDNNICAEAACVMSDSLNGPAALLLFHFFPLPVERLEASARDFLPGL